MKKALLFIAALCTVTLHAALSPSYYRGLQDNAPEALRIEVIKVETYLLAADTKSVSIEARVLSVRRSKSGLERGDELTIIYNTVFKRPKRWVGPASVPVLEEKGVYKAFLEKYKTGKSYIPAAGGKSFKTYGSW